MKKKTLVFLNIFLQESKNCWYNSSSFRWRRNISLFNQGKILLVCYVFIPSKNYLYIISLIKLAYDERATYWRVIFVAPGLWIFLRKWLYFSWNGCHIHSNWPVIFFFKSNQGSKSFTSLKADLRQDLNGGFAFSRCLNGTFPWRKCSVKALVS